MELLERRIPTDARTAVRLAECGAYGIVYEGLTHHGPAGSAYHCSREHHAQIHCGLSPLGSLIEVGVDLVDRGVLAATHESFPWLGWFPPDTLVASDDDAMLLHAGAVDPTTLTCVRAVRDDELSGELSIGC